ncbi:MAG: response regulator transcription factor [Bacteroidia bacterium]
MNKVLLVEDEVFLGRIVKESLEMRGFEVNHATDGEAGWQEYQTWQPDICVLDVMMPLKDGFTLAEEIRQHNKNLPIMFLTAKSLTDDVVKGFEIGGNDYLKKPFSMEELIVRITSLLKRSEGQTTENKEVKVVEIGKFWFDMDKQELNFQGEIKKLSHRESELLRFLYEYKNQVMERAPVLKQLWGDDNFFTARSMDVFITKLRAYLKKDSGVEILNVRGIGYKLVVSD